MNIGQPRQIHRRSYKSDLRAAQASATRERILNAVTGLIKLGASEVSIAGIARAANVSLPTVHRHFPTRRDLFEAYRLHVEGTRYGSNHDDERPPDTLAEAAPLIRRFFERFDDAGDPIRTMHRLRPPVAWEFSREVTVPRRRAWAERLADTECPGVNDEDRERLCDLMIVLVSSSMVEAMRGYLDMPVKTIADRVLWALDAIAAHARSRAGKDPARRPAAPASRANTRTRKERGR